MASTPDIRNRLIDSLMTVNDSEFLMAEEQKIMLSMSDEDIQNGRLIDQKALYKRELEWLMRRAG